MNFQIFKLHLERAEEPENKLTTSVGSLEKKMSSRKTSEGSGREGGGRGDWDGEYMYIQGWFMSMYDKNHYNIVK